MYSHTRRNSNAVAIGGFPENRRLGFLATNLLFHSSLYDLLATGFDITNRNDGAKDAAIGRSFSNGQIGLNFPDIPHMEPFNTIPFQTPSCFKEIRIEIAPPRDSP
ncbi:hypothetical protein IC575_018172 [Cucumis melo]